MRAALEDLGVRRFRLMSYWNIHEKSPGNYNFAELDWQLDLIAKYHGEASLCLGKRQPRWPECHMPPWAQKLDKQEWYPALFTYIETVIKRYRKHPALQSWQLENEALLKSFGHCVDQDYNPQRLIKELQLVKKLDPDHPVIMTLSDSWGLPWRPPQPDMYAMSLYRTTINQRGNYVFSKRPPQFYQLRALAITLLRRRSTFIHELQAEPWLHSGITTTPLTDQLNVLSPENLRKNILFAVRTGLRPIDLWGLEWWYWMRESHSHPEYWETVRKTLQSISDGKLGNRR